MGFSTSNSVREKCLKFNKIKSSFITYSIDLIIVDICLQQKTIERLIVYCSSIDGLPIEKRSRITIINNPIAEIKRHVFCFKMLDRKHKKKCTLTKENYRSKIENNRKN